MGSPSRLFPGSNTNTKGKDLSGVMLFLSEMIIMVFFRSAQS